MSTLNSNERVRGIKSVNASEGTNEKSLGYINIKKKLVFILINGETTLAKTTLNKRGTKVKNFHDSPEPL